MVAALWARGPVRAKDVPGTAARARAVLARIEGEIELDGLREPVEVLRDRWGTPHIYARSTPDLFFAQGFVVAQDRMWQLEVWRRGGEGRLAEALGPAYLARDRLARLLAFRGDWDREMRNYHPDGPLIFDSFARGVNAAIRKALAEGTVPVEFEIAGFRPEPAWTPRSILSRMPGWPLSRNATSEIARALQVKALGVAKVEELRPTEPERKLEIPAGLDLDDLEPAILDLLRAASSARLVAELGGRPRGGAAEEGREWGEAAASASNNWVVGGAKSATGMPLLANDPHREVMNPSLRYLVHLVAPGWNALGATEPGVPGITIGHNERIAWGFTILGVDQQDVYVEQTHPEDPDLYLHRGEWRRMRVERETLPVRGGAPVEIELKRTLHGPVLHESRERRRAFALRWAGDEPGAAGYVGSLGVVQARGWEEFLAGLARSWYLPSHSLVYADVDGNFGYAGVALTPNRKGWDGLLPVPGKDGRYEWDGFLAFERLPRSLNSPRGFYNTSNNDVVPKIVPGYEVPLGYEYAAPFRHDRVAEVLARPGRLDMAAMQALQQDKLSLPARELVPLLRGLRGDTEELRRALEILAGWDFVLDRDSAAAALYELWLAELPRLAYAPRLPEPARAGFQPHDIRRVIAWMKAPDAAYGPDQPSRRAERDLILLRALASAVAELRKRLGDRMEAWRWGDLHTAALRHPLASSAGAEPGVFFVEPVRRGGDAYTVMASGSPSEAGVGQASGASVMFVLDVGDWDRSTGLNTPGASGQPGSAHYADLAPLWGEARYFPLAFGRQRVEDVTAHRLLLVPAGSRARRH